MRVFLFLLVLFLPFAGFSEPVKITGSAPGAEGKSVHLFVTKDFITFLEEELTKARIDSLGQFSLSVNITHILSASLSIDFHRMELFLEPGKSYKLDIALMNYNSAVEVNPFIQSENLRVDFRNEDPDELNALIQQFNILHSNFLLNHFNDLYRDRNVALLDTFRFEIVRSFVSAQNSYFAIYSKYKMASLEQVAKAYSPAQLAKRYFSDSPVLYENVEYMSFFNQYFMKYLTATSRSLKFIDYHAILKGPSPYEAMMKALEADTLIKKTQLRELVMIKGLKEMYMLPDFNKENILTLLKTVSNQSKFPDNRLIAENLSRVLTHLSTGTAAPGFSLLDRNRKIVTLEGLRGKPVLLGFWTTYCQGCLSEMETMRNLHTKYGNKINFVSICADKEFMKMLFFIDWKKDFSWTFLHIGDQLELLKEYDVKSYPLFVLLDDTGNIFRYPADFPGKGLEASIEKLLNP